MEKQVCWGIWKVKKEGRVKLIAKARCGNLEERNEYWKSEDGELCELWLLEESTITRTIEECQKLERIELNIEERPK